MLLYNIFPSKSRAYDHRFEVLTIIALHFYMVAGQAIYDGAS